MSISVSERKRSGSLDATTAVASSATANGSTDQPLAAPQNPQDVVRGELLARQHLAILCRLPPSLAFRELRRASYVPNSPGVTPSYTAGRLHPRHLQEASRPRLSQRAKWAQARSTSSPSTRLAPRSGQAALRPATQAWSSP